METLRPAYFQTDNMKLTVKPLDCALDNAVTQADTELFEEHCVQLTAADPDDSFEPSKPLVILNSAFANFNVTNEASFENIDFEGNENLAFYQEVPNEGRPIQEFPYRFCEQIFVSDSHHGYRVNKIATVPFSYDCKRPKDLSNGVDDGAYPTSQTRCSESLSNKVKEHCSGELYSEDFFTKSADGYLARRRRVLFNLYAFDEQHTVEPKTPSLTLKDCKFSKFMSGQLEALIQVETNNMYLSPAEKGQWRHLGADNGAKILIEGSVFEKSRFCKGLIVYREGVDY